MCTIKLNDIMIGKEFPDSGNDLYCFILDNKDKCERIVIDMEGVSSLPSIFLNVSLGRYIEEFGVDNFRKLSFTHITKSQAERIRDYVKKSF